MRCLPAVADELESIAQRPGDRGEFVDCRRMPATLIIDRTQQPMHVLIPDTRQLGEPREGHASSDPAALQDSEKFLSGWIMWRRDLHAIPPLASSLTMVWSYNICENGKKSKRFPVCKDALTWPATGCDEVIRRLFPRLVASVAARKPPSWFRGVWVDIRRSSEQRHPDSQANFFRKSRFRHCLAADDRYNTRVRRT